MLIIDHLESSIQRLKYVAWLRSVLRHNTSRIPLFVETLQSLMSYRADHSF